MEFLTAREDASILTNIFRTEYCSWLEKKSVHLFQQSIVAQFAAVFLESFQCFFFLHSATEALVKPGTNVGFLDLTNDPSSSS